MEKLFDQIEYLEIPEFEKAEKKKEERTIIHYITTNAVDRGKDIVNPLGMDYTDFEKTKTVFYNHNYDKPIAKNVWIKQYNNNVKVGTQFSKSEFANDIYTLHLEDIIKTWSIGFDVPRKNGRWSDPIEGAIITDEKTGIRTINKWILLEYSSAPLAMNPNALDLAKNIKSYMKTDEIKNVIEGFEYKAEIQLMFEEQKTEIAELKTLIEEIKNKDTSELQSEITEIKNTLLKKSVESLAKPKQKFTAKEISDLVSGELSRITGIRN